jgi:hypothetical protein
MAFPHGNVTTATSGTEEVHELPGIDWWFVLADPKFPASDSHGCIPTIVPEVLRRVHGSANDQESRRDQGSNEELIVLLPLIPW